MARAKPPKTTANIAVHLFRMLMTSSCRAIVATALMSISFPLLNGARIPPGLETAVVLVVSTRLLRRAVPLCARGPERRKSQRKKQYVQLPFRIPVYRSFRSYTTSTEQWARAATADETLPSRKRSIRPIPLAPTKMQSAPQLSASVINNRFGSSSITTTLVLNPEARSLPTASSIILLTLAFSSAIQVMIGPIPRLEVIWGVDHVALTMRTSLPAGHLRVVTASTAASAPFEPSTPMINRTGVPGSSMRP